MPGLRYLAITLIAMAALAGCSSDSSDEPSKSISPSTSAPAKPVATVRGFGQVTVGMTLAEATAALAGIPFEQSHPAPYPCTTLFGPVAGRIYVADESGRVIGIATPDGTLTDRGVGDGSTRDEVEAAYSRDHTIEVGRFDGVIVKPTGSTNPLEFLSFAVKDGKLGPPYVGRYYFDDDCP